MYLETNHLYGYVMSSNKWIQMDRINELAIVRRIFS